MELFPGWSSCVFAMVVVRTIIYTGNRLRCFFLFEMGDSPDSNLASFELYFWRRKGISEPHYFDRKTDCKERKAMRDEEEQQQESNEHWRHERKERKKSTLRCSACTKLMEHKDDVYEVPGAYIFSNRKKVKICFSCAMHPPKEKIIKITWQKQSKFGTL